MNKYYPIKFHPIYKECLWGGDRINSLKNVSDKNNIAESWELSDRADGMSIVANGLYKNYSLNDLTKEMKENLLGKNKKFKEFPILIKLIDAKKDLSIQVHPDKKMDSLEEKNEAWYVLASDNDAYVYAGFNKKIDNKRLLESINSKNISQDLQYFSIYEGNVIFIPAGMVHSIGKGSFLLEVQQNSNTTYRLYDWDRVDNNGLRRTLHIDKALEAIDFDVYTKINNENPLCYCDHFVIERFLYFSKPYSYEMSKDSFHYYFCIKGKGSIIVDGYEEELNFSDSCLIPAAANKVTIIPDDMIKLLLVRLP